MGGRGAYWSGASKHYETRQFDSVDMVDDGRIKVLKIRENVKNLQFPLYSNTPDTIYFVLGKDDNSKIYTIGIYRNHRLTVSIDLHDQKGVHWHDWIEQQSSKGRYMAKSNTHHFDLNDEYKRLVKMAYEWESTKGGGRRK